MLKRLASPVRNYFNSRFSAVHQSVVQGHTADHELLTDTLSTVQRVLDTTGRMDEDLQQTLIMIGRTIDDLGHKLDVLTGEGGPGSSAGMAQLTERLDQISRRVGLVAFDREQQGALSQLGEYEASVANYTHAHDGWAAQAGLWFNPPTSVAHAAGGVSLSDVNERIAEIPFVFRQLAGLPVGSRIVDVGCTESTVSLSLASLGYDVTAVDPRPYPLSHPQLTTFQGPIADFRGEEPFDAVIFLSSIEHFGIGSYALTEEDDGDLQAMQRARELTRPGARLVLTTPYGDAATTPLERTYGVERLARLLEGWKVEEQSYLTRETPTVWRWSSELSDLRGDHVVLVSATRTDDPS